jgi:deoxyribonuclease-4
MKFGAHVSMAGGLWKAPKRAADLDCEVFQIFSRPPRGGKAKEITDDVVEKFQSAMKEYDMDAAYIHAPYYTNLASGKKKTRKNTIRILREELERGSKLGCKAMMFHPGSATQVGREDGIAYVVEGLNEVMDGYEGSCKLLIEISAGAGEIMGDTFEEIAAFLEGAERGDDIDVCFDTQHAFAAGYDLRTKDKLDETMNAFDEIVGLDKLFLSHLNDSKIALGENKDRHENIGEGEIGENAFKYIVEHPALQNVDLILETPGGEKRKDEIALLKSYR